MQHCLRVLSVFYYYTIIHVLLFHVHQTYHTERWERKGSSLFIYIIIDLFRFQHAIRIRYYYVHFNITLLELIKYKKKPEICRIRLGARWSSGSAFASDREVRDSTNVNFSGHKKWISEAPLDQGVNWYPERAVSVQVWYSWAPYVGCTPNREWNNTER